MADSVPVMSVASESRLEGMEDAALVVSEDTDSRFESVLDRPNSFLLARPSGTGFSAGVVDAGFTPTPSACAFLNSSFFCRIASLNSSLRSVFFGPPVTLRAALPRRILPLSSSGAT